MKPLTQILVMLMLGSGSLVGAQQWEWNPDGTGQYGAYSGPGRPSLPDQSREFHRQAEAADRQAEEWRQESLRQERERSSNSSKPLGYANDSYWIQDKNGHNTLCTPGYKGAVVTCQ